MLTGVMLSVERLGVVMLNVLMLSVDMMSVVMLSAVMLSVNMLSFDFTQSAIMLNVMTPILFPTTILKIYIANPKHASLLDCL